MVKEIMRITTIGLLGVLVGALLVDSAIVVFSSEHEITRGAIGYDVGVIVCLILSIACDMAERRGQ